VGHSRDKEGLGANHKVNLPKNQLQFSEMMMGYWFGKTKPKQAFRLTQNAFKKLLQNFNLMEFFD